MWNTFMKTKTVVVVGGSTGIGKELVTTFKNLGANVKSISRANCDITKQEEIDLYFSNINQDDILINNAAINYCKSIEEISLNEWNSVIDTNLTSYFYIIKKCLPLMKH